MKDKVFLMCKLFFNPFVVLQCVVIFCLLNSENYSNDLVGMPFMQIDEVIERINKNIQ